MTAAELSNTLRRARLDRGWTQTELAQTARVTQSWISKMESGRSDTLRLREILAVLRALDLELDVVGRDHVTKSVLDDLIESRRDA